MASDKPEIEIADGASPQDHLAAEQSMAPRVAGLTVVAGLFPLIGKLVQGPLGNAPKNFITSFLYWHDHSGNIITGSVLQAIGYLAMVVTVLYLLRAAIARGAQPPRFTPGLAMIGGVVNAIGTVALAVAYVLAANKFAKETGFTWAESSKLWKGGGIIASSAAGLLGSVALAFAIVMASLNAMRVGLLTRLMGYIGILAGALLALQFIQPLPVVQAFWFVALAAIFSGRWPGGRPEAWEDGEAHPWPTAAEQRARAAEAREARNNEG